MRYNGSDYRPELDDNRLMKQEDRIKNLMIDGKWRTLGEIANGTGDPEASISAQLRHLTKDTHGGFIKNKRYRGPAGNGVFEYQILKPEENGQLKLL
jgi:hypothetical protein